MRSRNRVSHTGRLATVLTKSFALFIGLIALAISLGCGGRSGTINNVTPPVISSTIPVGTSPRAITVDSTDNKIYVTDFGTTPTGVQGCTPSGADVTAIDGATQSATSVGFWFASTPMNPFVVALNPANHTLYVLVHQYWSGIGSTPGECGPFGEAVELFDATSLQQTSNHFDVGGTGINVNPTTGTIYVARPGGTVDVWDSSWNLLATVPVGTTPAGVAVNATTNKVYVANSGSNDVSVIDGASNSVVATIADPNAVAPVAIAVNATTNTIYVVNAQSNNLTVIDGATGSVTATVTVGTSPSGGAVDTQRNAIYVTNAGSSQTGNSGNVTIIDGVTNATTTLSDPKALNPAAVAVDSDTNKIYVANSGSNNVTVIDGAHD